MTARSYVLAVSKPWVLETFLEIRPRLPGEWSVVRAKDDLAAMLASQQPRYVFFPHWSHRVPQSITTQFECVCFHMTDLPYGRGGSPLQNLISRGHRETTLTALRMTSEVDAGPIYAKRPLSLEGSAAEIFDRSAPLVCELIEWIVQVEPDPEPQAGEPTVFHRRKPEESEVPSDLSATQLHDHIRMLDAPGYPKAFMRHGPWRLEFDQAKLVADRVQARVTFRPEEENP
jgi:methionyl-tRNA formyltransferase